MKQWSICFLFVILFKFSFANDSIRIHIIPQPVSLLVQKGTFRLNSGTQIIINNPKSKEIAALLIKKLNTVTGFHYKGVFRTKDPLQNVILLNIVSSYDSVIGEEGYHLLVNQNEIRISANTLHGLFYGVQTLRQLLPSAIESDTVNYHVDWLIPSVKITDHPKFKWRGLMLDVSRHFFDKAFVEKYIDEMAKYKYNVFHWHLTDDQGWRIEIKGLPNLTKTGAWRVSRTGPWRSIQGPQPGEPATAGGYYTQDDIKEIVRYAQKRFVTILPEIDVPAHSLALIASYPNLSCTKKQYPVYPKYAPDSLDNVLCVANDSTWLILDKIFTQVAQLFPSEYIHVGGDEANRKFWTKDPKDVALMKKEGLKTPAELQSYFEKKLEKLILSKGKKMIGWDEILEGGLAPEATVMSWRGMQGGIKATQMGHHVIMSPYGQTYISQIQGDPLVEPAGPGMTRLKECYYTNILPNGIAPDRVLGGEACLWTEFVPYYRHAEYMTYPRALALSEVFWGTTGNWVDFTRRVEKQFSYLDAAHVKYARSMFDPIISAIKDTDGLKVVLNTEVPGLKLYYTFDGTNPDNFYPEYRGQPLSIPKGATEIRVVTFRDGKKIGRQINCPVNVLEKRIRKN